MAKRRYNAKNRQRTPALDYTDTAPSYRWQHSPRDLTLTDTRGVLAERALEECQLDRWFLAGYIDESERTAGLALREDYFIGEIPVRTCRIYPNDAPRPTKHSGLWSSPAERRSPHAEQAYQRWRQALRYLGSRNSLLLNALCCEDKPVSLQHRSDIRQALQLLGKFYR